MRHALLGVMASIAIGMAIIADGGLAGTLARQATPQPAAPVVIASEVLVRASPVAVTNPELALGRVTIMPGAAIPVHHHPGTQTAAIVQGVLTYTVFTGSVTWYRADSPSGAPVQIMAGQTVEVRAGDALVEMPDSIHQGSNAGNVPVVIYLSTLFPANAPRAILDATPVAP